MDLQNKIIDLSFLWKFTEGNKDKMKFYIELYLKTAPRLFEGLEVALDSMNYNELYTKAHSLKPQSSYVGIISLPEKLAEIEDAARQKRDHRIIKELLEKAVDLNQKGTNGLETYLKGTKEV
jgi:hypothetical protein